MYDGRLALPFPVSSGRWTGHVFQARYREDALAWAQIRRFRQWFASQARKTDIGLTAQVGDFQADADLSRVQDSLTTGLAREAPVGPGPLPHRKALPPQPISMSYGKVGALR